MTKGEHFLLFRLELRSNNTGNPYKITNKMINTLEDHLEERISALISSDMSR